MAVVGFFSSPERSHINATLGLARALQRSGHEVVYITVADFADHIRNQGMRVHVAYEDVWPLGTQALIERWPELGPDLRTIMFARLDDPRFDHELLDAQLDLLVVDSLSYPAALVGYRAGLPVVLARPTLPTIHDNSVPPPTSYIVPGTPFSRLRIRLAWKALELRVKLERRDLKQTALSFVPNKRAQAASFPPRLLDTSGPIPRLRGLPELVLCPRAFDLPRSRDSANIHYVEAFVDTERSDRCDFDDQVLDDPRPLVYCAFGTCTHRYDSIRALLVATIRALGGMPEIHGLVSLGSVPASELGTVPANVTVVPQVPQIAVLRRARAMINHGGLNSIKECIHAGVPMLVVPWAKPVNAVCVAYHGLGSVLMPGAATPDAIRRELHVVLYDDKIRARVAAMRAEFEAVAREGAAVRLIESRLPLALRGSRSVPVRA